MEKFVEWGMLLDFATLVSIVYLITQFTKNIKYVKKVPTSYWSFFIALFLVCVSNVEVGSFRIMDIVLYAISSIMISMSANGLHDFPNNFKKKEGVDDGMDKK